MAETADPRPALPEAGGACRAPVVDPGRALRVVASGGRWQSAEMQAADPVAPASLARPVGPELVGQLQSARAVALAQVG